MPALGSSVVNCEKALSLKIMGATYKDLADMYHCTPATVHKVLSTRYKDIDIEEFCAYAKAPDFFFELEAYRLISKLSNETRLKMLERRGVTDIAILTDKARLVRGQSTSINEIVPTQVINVIQARLEVSASNNLTDKSQVIDITPDKDFG